jgi:hypothetical protein
MSYAYRLDLVVNPFLGKGPWMIVGWRGACRVCFEVTFVACISIMPSKRNSLPSRIYLVIRLQCFDPLLGHHQAYINTRKCITFYILRAKRDPINTQRNGPKRF